MTQKREKLHMEMMYSKKDKKSEKSQNNEDNVKDSIDEDKFEKTANELEEVLKRKFPDVSPPKTSSPKSHSTSKTSNNTNVPILTTSETIKQEVKEEAGLTSRKENDKITNITHSNNLNSSQHTSSPSLPQPANIPNKIKTEESNGSKKASNTTKENDSIKMDIISSSP